MRGMRRPRASDDAHSPAFMALFRPTRFLAQARSSIMVWLATSSVTNPAVLATITPSSVAASSSTLSKPCPMLTTAFAVSISSITSRGIGTPRLMMTSAPLIASITSPWLEQT